MREVDRPSLVLVYFNIPTFTPGSLRSVAYRHVSSAKRAKFTLEVWGVSFMYKLYRVGERTEPCGTPACMYLGVDISPSTETLNFRSERKELISFVKTEAGTRSPEYIGTVGRILRSVA
jgi:hypothetical protein